MEGTAGLEWPWEGFAGYISEGGFAFGDYEIVSKGPSDLDPGNSEGSIPQRVGPQTT